MRYSPRVGNGSVRQVPVTGTNQVTLRSCLTPSSRTLSTTNALPRSARLDGCGTEMPDGIGSKAAPDPARYSRASAAGLFGSRAPGLSEQSTNTGPSADNKARHASSERRCWNDHRVHPLPSISARFLRMMASRDSPAWVPNGCQNPIVKSSGLMGFEHRRAANVGQAQLSQGLARPGFGSLDASRSHRYTAHMCTISQAASHAPRTP